MHSLHTHRRHAIAGGKDRYRSFPPQRQLQMSEASRPGSCRGWRASWEDDLLALIRWPAPNRAASMPRGPIFLREPFAYVTPTPSSLPGSVGTVRDLWEGVGCRLIVMPPSEHDECIARVSHVPHAVAAALVNAINLRVADAGAIAGGGYRDTTRIAASPPAMWREIFIENRAELAAGLDDFSTMLEKIKEMILSSDAAALETFLERAKTHRENLP